MYIKVMHRGVSQFVAKPSRESKCFLSTIKQHMCDQLVLHISVSQFHGKTTTDQNHSFSVTWEGNLRPEQPW